MQNLVGCTGWCSDVFQGMNIGNSIKTAASLRTKLEMEVKAERIKSAHDDVQRTLCQWRAFTSGHVSVMCTFASR